jgi:hypothetical protein
MSRAQNASKNEKSEKHGTYGNERTERLGDSSELGGIRNLTSNAGGVNGVRQKRFLSALDSVSLSPLPLP